ncbi:MAG TPA: hypothetical protein VFM73_04680 [Xanthomonadaceae bacterium]|nr:hypothetical protein [Xanthomonadaceae bacterium]
MTRRRWPDAILSKAVPLLLLVPLLGACDGPAVLESGAQYGGSVTSADHDLADGPVVQDDTPGAESVGEGRAGADAMPPGAARAPAADASGPDWDRTVVLDSGTARVACDQDYSAEGDGEPLASLERDAIEAALAPCVAGGALRLHYDGKIAGDFDALVRRIVAVADDTGISNRVLDIDSSGGRIEDAIRVGDAIAESGWTVWVREDAVCHSACVLVIAAGDMRMIAGPVGVHRMVRIGSAATSRAELNQELQAVYEDMKGYLQRNGAAVAVADLMMTVPNHSLRLLTADELDWFGLAGRNAAEDDLQRIELARRCGEDFVQRKDAFFRMFDARCAAGSEAVEDMNACGLALREQFGFPDETCPDDGPLLELGDMPQVAATGSGGDQA